VRFQDRGSGESASPRAGAAEVEVIRVRGCSWLLAYSGDRADRVSREVLPALRGTSARLARCATSPSAIRGMSVALAPLPARMPNRGCADMSAWQARTGRNEDSNVK